MVAKQAGEINKHVISENYTSFTNCIKEINNAKTNNIKHFDLVMAIYDLIEYIHSYFKAFGTLWQYYSDGPGDNDIVDSEYFKLKETNSRIHSY